MYFKKRRWDYLPFRAITFLTEQLFSGSQREEPSSFEQGNTLSYFISGMVWTYYWVSGYAFDG